MTCNIRTQEITKYKIKYDFKMWIIAVIKIIASVWKLMFSWKGKLFKVSYNIPIKYISSHKLHYKIQNQNPFYDSVDFLYSPGPIFRYWTR